MSETTSLATDQQELICVLAAYRAAEQTELKARPAPVVAAEATAEDAASDADDAGWIPRLRELPGIPNERLSPLHGQLIAHGLLRFGLLGRAVGVGYRVTPEGREVLARVGATSV